MHQSWATYPDSNKKQACVKDLEQNIGPAFKISTWQKIEWELVEDVYCLRQLFGHKISIRLIKEFSDWISSFCMLRYSHINS